MGVSIDVFSFDYDALRWAFKKLIFDQHPELKDNEDGYAKVEQIGRIMKEFGSIVGDRYIILNDEYHEEYSPYYEIGTFIDRYYNVEDSSDAMYSKEVDRLSIGKHSNAGDAADNLGIELPEEE